MAKIAGTELGFRVADRCMQIHGAMGLTLEMPISKMWRDARSFTITEGPAEVMRMVLAREIFAGGLALRHCGQHYSDNAPGCRSRRETLCRIGPWTSIWVCRLRGLLLVDVPCHPALRRRFMAHFCYASSTDGCSSVRMGLPDVVQLGLWGGGPNGEALDIVVKGPPIVKVSFPAELKSFPVPHLRVFELIGVSAGRTALEARVPRTGAPYTALLPVTVGATNDLAALGMSKFYDGTSLEQAKKLMTMDLAPMAVPEAQLLDVNEYTDFGKGFYTHPEESKGKAVEWAKRRNKDWGVVRFPLTTEEMSAIRSGPSPLHFPDKFKTRPGNAPKLFNGQPASWIEFVEFNRHVRTTTIKRPKDNDWTGDYAWMRGPIWGRADSGLPGAPGLPERYHQINWGLNAMKVLNGNAPKRRRFLITKHNEHLL
jgi:hypothetical protein